MFEAIHNVSIGLHLYKRGEEIHDVPKDMQERLLTLGAIRKLDAPFPMPEEDMACADTDSDVDETDAFNDEQGMTGDEATPEIDLMDGIVAEEIPAVKGRSRSK